MSAHLVYFGANEHDSTQVDNLLNGEETEVYGASAYRSAVISFKLEEQGIKDKIHRKVYRGTSDLEKQKIRQDNNQLSKVRCKVEHIYGVIKSKFGYRKVKYKGVKKNAQNIAALLVLANLYLASPKLIQMQT